MSVRTGLDCEGEIKVPMVVDVSQKPEILLVFDRLRVSEVLLHHWYTFTIVTIPDSGSNYMENLLYSDVLIGDIDIGAQRRATDITVSKGSSQSI